MFDLQSIVRPNIWNLKPYRCARDDYSEGILLDANENSLGPSLPFQPQFIQGKLSTNVSEVDKLREEMEEENEKLDPKNQFKVYYSDDHLERYPDPYQKDIKIALAKFRGLPPNPDHFFIGVGSDESIDLIIRVFCCPGTDSILICPPTYGMYTVCAQVNDVGVIKVPLFSNFQLDVPKIKKAISEDKNNIKVLFLCSPGNPTGTLLKSSDVRELLEYPDFKGIVVIDEAYIDFSTDEKGNAKSLASWVLQYPNLVVIQTLSKSFGLAGIRVGVAISSPDIAQLFNKTKAPYNISTPTALLARSALSYEGIVNMKSSIQKILENRFELIKQLTQNVPFTGKIIGDNDANFVLVQILNDLGTPCNERAFHVYKQLAEQNKVVVRYRGTELWCEGCLRITVGTKDENRILIEKMKEICSRFKT